MLGYLFGQITSTPIYNQHNHDTAIVVTRPVKPANEIYSINDTIMDPDFPEEAIVPPPPPPVPHGPLYTKIILPDGSVLYTPMDIRPFLI